MRIKKIMSGMLIACTAVSVLAGCQKGLNITNPGNEPTVGVTDTNKKPSQTPTGSTSVKIDDIKVKYENDTTVEYGEAFYNLEKNHTFSYDITESFFDLEIDEYDCFTVYYDAELTKYADAKILTDYDTMKLTISPGLVFDYNEEGSLIGDGTWGTRSKFYLVQYKDLATGEDFEKPLVTVFTVKEDLTAPTLTQQMGEDGFYFLTWTEVLGADYYEVYEYSEGADSAFLEYTTTETFGSYKNFETHVWSENRFEETYGDTEIDVNNRYMINKLLDEEVEYFVVAKTNDGKCSGMSNECCVGDIANQIPRRVSDDFIREYSGDTILALPAYVDVEMLDGSTSKFLIEYVGSTATLLDDGRIFVEPTIRNIPLNMPILTFTGMSFEDFMGESELIKDRIKELSNKSVTVETEINIPYVPNVEDEVKETKTEELDVDAALMETVYSNTALGEWIAINLLAHEEEISLAGFPECANTEYLSDAFMEAYIQNPLCGIVTTIDYNYNTNSLNVNYVLDAEETAGMQADSLKKAQEIVDEIITDGMSDYEKEIAINSYLCENAQYNDAIMDYINEDGTISFEVVYEYAHSFTPYGVLVDNLGVCESYSEAFLLLCYFADMDAIIETGRMGGVNHEWNRVSIGGNWYLMDVTNNDSENLPNCYFNLSDALAEGILVSDNRALINDCIDNYSANTTECEYYNKNGLVAESKSDAADMLAEILSENDTAVIRTSKEFDEATVLEIVQNAASKAGVVNAMYYYNNGIISIVKK